MLNNIFEPIYSGTFTLTSFLICTLVSLALGVVVALAANFKSRLSKSFLLSRRSIIKHNTSSLEIKAAAAGQPPKKAKGSSSLTVTVCTRSSPQPAIITIQSNPKSASHWRQVPQGD